MLLKLVVLALICGVAMAASKKKPHGHNGILEPYDGKPIPLKITPDQSKKLDKGEAVWYNEREGKSGRGVVIQDVNASSTICMSKIRDLPMYHKMVPHCKGVTIYENQKFLNGTTRTAAEFNVGVMGMGFGYFLMLTHEPKYDTLTWTLDYRYNSDFDDNCGHWQVMSHPSKRGWTRVLYSTKLKLFSWIPEFVVKFLTGKALIESTGWVKKESELEAAKVGAQQSTKLGSWFNIKGGSLKSHMKSSIQDFNGKLKNFNEDITARKQRVVTMMAPRFNKMKSKP